MFLSVKRSETTAMSIKYISMDVLCLTRSLKAFTRDALVDVLTSTLRLAIRVGKNLNGNADINNLNLMWFSMVCTLIDNEYASSQCVSCVPEQCLEHCNDAYRCR